MPSGMTIGFPMLARQIHASGSAITLSFLTTFNQPSLAILLCEQSLKSLGVIQLRDIHGVHRELLQPSALAALLVVIQVAVVVIQALATAVVIGPCLTIKKAIVVVVDMPLEQMVVP